MSPCRGAQRGIWIGSSSPSRPLEAGSRRWSRSSRRRTKAYSRLCFEGPGMSKISNVENLRFLKSCWFLFRLLLKVRSMVGGHLPLVRTRWAERAGVLASICVATCIPAHALHIQRKGMTSGRTLRGGAPSSSPNRGVGPARQESSDFDSSQLQSSSTFAAFERLGSSATMSQLELGAFGVRRVPKTMELLRFMVQPTLLPHCDSMPSSTATCL